MEFATGGLVKGDGELPAVLTYWCDYIIPQSFADKWKEALDKLNEGGVD